jgi:hypothetical protein
VDKSVVIQKGEVEFVLGVGFEDAAVDFKERWRPANLFSLDVGGTPTLLGIKYREPPATRRLVVRK